MTPDGFDPYWEWLRISPGEQPVDHYRLLGVLRFESNRRVLEDAADDRMQAVYEHKSGPHAEHSRRLLSELAAAKVCLFDPQQKTAYDARLRGEPVSTGASEEAASPAWKPAPLRLDDEPRRSTTEPAERSESGSPTSSEPSSSLTPAAGGSRLMPPSSRRPTAPAPEAAATPLAPPTPGPTVSPSSMAASSPVSAPVSWPTPPAAAPMRAPAAAPAQYAYPPAPAAPLPTGIPVARLIPVATAIPVARAVPMASAAGNPYASPGDDAADFNTFDDEPKAQTNRRVRRRRSESLSAIGFLFQVIVGGVIGIGLGFWILQKIRSGELKLPFLRLPPSIETNDEPTNSEPSAARTGTTSRTTTSSNTVTSSSGDAISP